MWKPPPAEVISRAALWRLCSQLPRPSLPVDVVAFGGPQNAVVFAPYTSEDAEAWEDAEAFASEFGSNALSEFKARRVVTSLCDEKGRRFFRSAEHLQSAFSAQKLSRLAQTCHQQLLKCAPTYHGIGDWTVALEAGARDHWNRDDALRAFRSMTDNRLPRIELFYGQPPALLTLGQRIAFDAARSIYIK